MAQHDYVIANGTGAAVRSDLNNALAAIVSQNSGATAPATTYAYQFWADTTTGLLKLRNSANSAWVTLFQLDGEWSTLPVENGTAAAPSIYFKDSGTDTGFYSPGTDQVAISTGGTGRLFINSSGSIGIGTSSPSQALEISNGYLRIGTDKGIKFDTSNSVNDSELSIDSSGVISFKNSAGSSTVSITNAGNVGIGTTSPGTTLDVNGGAQVTGSVSGYNGGEVRLGATTADLNHAISTQSTGTPTMLFDHRGTGNTGQFAWRVGTGAASERMRIDSSGRLLVGTSSSDWTRPRVVIVGNPNETTTGAGVLYLQKANGTVNTGDKIGEIAFSTSSSNVGVYAEIICEGDATGGASDFPGRLVFKTCTDGGTSTVERMRIKNDGTVLIDATSYSIRGATAVVGDFGSFTLENSTTFGNQIAGLLVNKTLGASNTAQNSNVLVLAGDSGAATSPGNLIRGYSGNGGTTLNFQVAHNGNVTNTNNSYTAISDISLKENIVDAKSQWSDIKALRVVNYNFKPETGYETTKQLGLIAQEVETVSPDLVQQTILEDGTPDPQIPKSLKYSVLYMKAVKALQEAMERIEQLEAEMAEVKAQLS